MLLWSRNGARTPGLRFVPGSLMNPSRGNLLTPLIAGQICVGIKQELAFNRWKTSYIISLMMMRSETKIQRAAVLCTFKTSIFFFSFSTKPGNCTSPTPWACSPMPCCPYAHTCGPWASGAPVRALRPSSKCKLKTGLERVVERFIFLELATM